jgi:hypothetical protein
VDEAERRRAGAGDEPTLMIENIFPGHAARRAEELCVSFPE